MTTFAELHQGSTPLLLPNAWDVPSALALVADGYPALGTTSFGVASSLGHPDGTRATREANLRLAERLVALPVPVSMDAEDAYSDDPTEAAAYVAELSAIGVAGVNLEDSLEGRLLDPSAVAAKVAAVKERSPDVFVNARVDNFWFKENDTVEAAGDRAAAYVEAGADGIFYPGVTDPDTIRSLAGSLAVPVNVLAIPGMSLAELGDLGVRRVSTGSLPYRAAITAAALAAAAIRDGEVPPAAASYAEMQDRLVQFDS